MINKLEDKVNLKILGIAVLNISGLMIAGSLRIEIEKMKENLTEVINMLKYLISL